VLGIARRDGTYIGAPKGKTPILAGDNLIVYGRIGACKDVDDRRRGVLGDLEHQQAVAEQSRVVEEQEAVDPARAGAG